MDQISPEPAGAPLVGVPVVAGEHLSQLLHRAAKGDQQAFAELYDLTSSRVFGLAVRVVRDLAQAEEVTQEAFLEVWKTSSRFDPARGSALSWLMTICHRKAVDRVRSAEASTRRDTSFHQQNQTIDHDVTADAAQASMEAQRVRGALKGLTEVQREAIEARLLRRLHPLRGRGDPQPPRRHRQDPNPRRPDQAARQDGSRNVTHPLALHDSRHHDFRTTSRGTR